MNTTCLSWRYNRHTVNDMLLRLLPILLSYPFRYIPYPFIHHETAISEKPVEAKKSTACCIMSHDSIYRYDKYSIVGIRAHIYHISISNIRHQYIRFNKIQSQLNTCYFCIIADSQSGMMWVRVFLVSYWQKVIPLSLTLLEEILWIKKNNKQLRLSKEDAVVRVCSPDTEGEKWNFVAPLQQNPDNRFAWSLTALRIRRM